MQSNRVVIVVGVICVAVGVTVGGFRNQIGRMLLDEPAPQTNKTPSVQLPQPIPGKPPAKPVFGWKSVQRETFELNTREFRTLASIDRAGRVKIILDGETALFFGVFQHEELQAISRRNQIPRQPEFDRSKCGRTGVVRIEFECEVVAGDVLLLRDKRAEGAALTAVFGGLTRSNSLVDRATKPNKVAYELSIWDCIENCER